MKGGLHTNLLVKRCVLITFLFLDSFQAFLTPEYIKQNPDYAPYVEKLKELIVDQVRA